MCLTMRSDYHYFNCIIDRMGRVYWLKNTMSHRDIEDYIEGYKPTDLDSITKRITKIFKDLENLEDRDYYEVKIIPKDTKKVTRNREDWEFDIWEILGSPIWFRENREQYEENCWKCWEESIKVNLVIDHETINIKDIFIFATGNSRVEAHGNAKVVAINSATVEAYDNVTVESYDNVRVDANDNTLVEADNGCVGYVRIRAYNNATIKAFSYEDITANDNVTVEAHLNATIRADENAKVEAYGNVSVESHDNSTVKVYNHATVNAWGGTIEAYDCAVVWRCWHEAKITVKSKFAVVIDTDIIKGDDNQFHMTGKIIVSKDATVERQQE